MPLGTITKRDCQSRFLYIKKRVATKKSKIDKLRLENGQSVRPPRNEVGLGEAQRAFRYLNAVFSSFLQDDIGEDRLLPLGNPCQILKAKKLRKVLKPRERFLDDSQRSLLYDTLASASNPEYPGSIQPNDADLIWLLLHTGLRLDEARTMLWSSVDFLKEAFTAYDTKNHKDHTLPMTAATKEMFVRRYDTKTGNYVFPSPLDSDKPMSASRTFDRVCGEVGFEFTAHDLRRTFATVAADLGYDINTIGSLLNHAKGGVTAGYIQRTQKRFKNVLEAIQDGLFAQPFDETEEMQEPIVACRVN
jgi:integrase